MEKFEMFFEEYDRTICFFAGGLLMSLPWIWVFLFGGTFEGVLTRKIRHRHIKSIFRMLILCLIIGSCEQKRAGIQIHEDALPMYDAIMHEFETRQMGVYHPNIIIRFLPQILSIDGYPIPASSNYTETQDGIAEATLLINLNERYFYDQDFRENEYIILHEITHLLPFELPRNHTSIIKANRPSRINARSFADDQFRASVYDELGEYLNQ